MLLAHINISTIRRAQGILEVYVHHQELVDNKGEYLSAFMPVNLCIVALRNSLSVKRSLLGVFHASINHLFRQPQP